MGLRCLIEWGVGKANNPQRIMENVQSFNTFTCLLSNPPNPLSKFFGNERSFPSFSIQLHTQIQIIRTKLSHSLNFRVYKKKSFNDHLQHTLPLTNYIGAIKKSTPPHWRKRYRKCSALTQKYYYICYAKPAEFS